MTRVISEEGIILHTRPYRETSLLVKVITKNYGLITGVAKGTRGSKRGNILQPFNRFLLNWSGSTSLVNLNSYEMLSFVTLAGRQTTLAFYLAELLIRLLPEGEEMPRVFLALDWALKNIGNSTLDSEVTLRTFEKLLLEEIGYGIDFNFEYVSGKEIQPDRYYVLVGNQGFIAAPNEEGFLGSNLLDISEARFLGAGSRRAAKNIFRALLNEQLGDRPLLSRKLIRSSVHSE